MWTTAALGLKLASHSQVATKKRKDGWDAYLAPHLRKIKYALLKVARLIFQESDLNLFVSDKLSEVVESQGENRLTALWS